MRLISAKHRVELAGVSNEKHRLECLVEKLETEKDILVRQVDVRNVVLREETERYGYALTRENKKRLRSERAVLHFRGNLFSSHTKLKNLREETAQLRADLRRVRTLSIFRDIVTGCLMLLLVMSDLSTHVPMSTALAVVTNFTCPANHTPVVFVNPMCPANHTLANHTPVVLDNPMCPANHTPVVSDSCQPHACQPHVRHCRAPCSL